MSARKTSSFLQDAANLEVRESRLTLSEDAYVIHRGGIEFRSPTPFSLWTEMTLALDTHEGRAVHCSGVVIGCSGNKVSGYHVSVVFTSLSEQARAQMAALAQLVQSPLA